MEELDPFCDQFQEIKLTDTFYDNLFLLCKYVDDETTGDNNATTVALEKFRADPAYNESLYKMWLYITISKWHKIIQDSNKFTTAEELCAIYLMRAITEISRTAICYDGCNILIELTKIINNSFAAYSITGWQFLCSEHTFESLMRSFSTTSTNYISEFETENYIEEGEDNIENVEEIQEYQEKCNVLIDIITEFLSCKFTLTTVKLAAQKFVDRTVTLKSDLVFNVPKTYHVWVEPKTEMHRHHKEKKIDKKKSKDTKMIDDAEPIPPQPSEEGEEAEKENNLRDLYEIFPSRMSLEANSDEFWENLIKKYAEQNEEKLEQAAGDNGKTKDDVEVLADGKKTKKGKKAKKEV